MPIYRYQTEGATGVAAAAVTPLPATNPIASSWGLVKTVGSPSTLQIPTPRPQSTRGYGILGVPGNGAGYPEDWPQPSGHSPDYFLPSIYYTAPTPQQVRHESTNELPVPALSPSSLPNVPASTTPTVAAATPAVVQRARRMGGRLVQAWPKIAQFWPTFGSGVNNSANSGGLTG